MSNRFRETITPSGRTLAQFLNVLHRTFDGFVVARDVLESGEAHGFGADEGADVLRVPAEAEHATPAHYDLVDVRVHLGVDKGDVVKQVDAPILDRFDRRRAAAEHP